MLKDPIIAVLLPCLNEGRVIAEVVRRSHQALPTATVYVYDNGSNDGTCESAQSAGAIVRFEPKRGKGNVIRRMFADIEADIYVMLDGDGTYEIEAAPYMIDLLRISQLDLVTGKRIDKNSTEALYRFGHRIGNRLFTTVLRRVFGSDCEDVLSGYRVMTKRFVKSFPAVSKGFEIEVEMTAHASLLRLPSGEYPTFYVERPADSFSKLSTFRDGFRIARSLFQIFRAYSPSRFFGTLSLISGGLSTPFFIKWGNSAELATATDSLIFGALFALISALVFALGVILNAFSRNRVETLRLNYLTIPLEVE